MKNRKNAKEIFNEFLEEKGIHLDRINSAFIPQGLIIPKNPKITLCGDAVGLTKSWSGGGVIWSLTAATLLLKNFPDFLKYQKELRKVLFTANYFLKNSKEIGLFFWF